MLTKATLLFDNPSTIVFAVFMSFWSVLYLELWRRRSDELIYRWGLVGWDHSAEHPRPQYLALLNKLKILKAKEKINTVTMEKELRVSFWRVRVPATMLSFSIVILLLVAAIAAVFAVVFYRMSRITTNKIFGQELDSFHYRTFALPSIAAAINLVSSKKKKIIFKNELLFIKIFNLGYIRFNLFFFLLFHLGVYSSIELSIRLACSSFNRNGNVAHSNGI